MADPIQKPQSEAQAYIARLESTLDELADLVGASLGSADPDTIRRRVKDIRTERDTAHAALTRICGIVERSAPACPQDAVDAVLNRMAIAESTTARAVDAEEHRNRLNRRIEMIGYALDDAGAQKVYTSGDPGRPITEAERIRLLGDRIENLREQARIAQVTNDYQSITLDKMSAAAVEADKALDALRAPCLADGITMTIAARIRAIAR